MKMILALMAFALSLQTFAYDMSGKFGLGISGGVPVPIGGNNFDDAHNGSWGASAYGRYHVNSALGLELGVSHDVLEDSTLKFNNASLLAFWREAKAFDLTPIIGAGVGFTKIKDYDPSNTKLSLLGRLGLEYGLSEILSLAALLDYQYISKMMGDMPDKAHIINPQIALTWYFGGEKEKTEAKPVEEVKPAEEVKTAPEVKKIEEVKEKDEGLKIQKVEGREEISIEVEFASGKAVVAPSYADHLEKVAAFFKKHPDITAQIQGYTDNVGPAASNKKLSQKRADAVKKYLIKLGVEPKRLTAKGFGSENPIADNSSAEGKQQNRRVIAVIHSK